MAAMDFKGLENLAKELIEENKDSLQDENAYLQHLIFSYDVAYGVVSSIHSKYPLLKERINLDEVALAAGIHDVGRQLRRNQLFHELRGAEYVEKKGLEKGVSDSLSDVYRIAQMIRPHFVVSEQFSDEENAQERAEFEYLDPILLVPRTWHEKIIVYSDLSNANGKKVFFKDRIEEIINRYSNNDSYKNSNLSMLNSLKKGYSRIINTCEKVQKLSEGKLTETEVLREGFI